MKKVSAGLLALAFLAATGLAQTPGRAAAARRTEFSLNVGVIPQNFDEEEVWIMTLGGRVDLPLGRYVSFAPELMVWTTFPPTVGYFLPGVGLHVWLGNFSLGAGASFYFDEGTQVIPKFSAGLRTGRHFLLSVHVWTLFEGYAAWGGSIGYVF